MMKKENLHRQLVQRYLDGTASVGEVEAFFHLLNEGQLDQDLLEENPPVRRLKTLPFKIRSRYALAAAAILLVAVGAFLLLRPGRPKPQPAIAGNVFKNDVAPGGNKATLTLGDGTTIVLDSAGKGAITSQGGARIVKTNAGQLAYEANGTAGTPVYNNILSTPAGGQYQVTLSDGTKVWLNAVSKLRYPSSFKGNERVVELEGEGYFEVAGDKAHPFAVKAGGTQVQVLGTHFNVNAYADEPAVTTTLLTGSVRLTHATETVQLKPGQQGLASGATGLRVQDADVDQVMAWKNGSFSWDEADVHTVMRQLSRWYGVEIKYQGQPTTAMFGGEIQRDLSLTQVLTGLSKSKVHFRLEGKTLTVLP